jgi:PhnB protein
MTRPKPEGFRSITPHLAVRDAPAAIDFYRKAFEAEELYRNTTADGAAVTHAELLLGDSRFFVNDEFPEHGVKSPRTVGGASVTLHIYVEDVDAVFQRAGAAGAKILVPPADQFWGDRYGILEDPFGHRWSIATMIEDLAPGEIQRRSAAHERGEGEGGTR